jgi:hypothetical protein
MHIERRTVQLLHKRVPWQEQNLHFSKKSRELQVTRFTISPNPYFFCSHCNYNQGILRASTTVFFLVFWEDDKKKLTLALDVVDINREGSTLGVIPLICKNGFYDMKMGNLFHSLLATSTIPTIKIVNPLAP